VANQALDRMGWSKAESDAFEPMPVAMAIRFYGVVRT
jgi:hypothetical protein